MSINNHYNHTSDLAQNQTMSNSRDQKYNESSLSSSTRSTFSSLKSKTEDLFNQIAAKHANTSFSRQISRIVTAGTVASSDPCSALNMTGSETANSVEGNFVEPTKEEELSLYPSYCRKVEGPEYQSECNSDALLPDNLENKFTIPYYELDIRGCVTLPPPQNRRTKLALLAARRIAGVNTCDSNFSVANSDINGTNSKYSNTPLGSRSNSLSLNNFFGDIQSIRNDTSELENESIPPQSKPLRPMNTQPANILESRMRPFLCRPIACRSVDVEVFSKDGESMCFNDVTETASTGRFNTRMKIPFLPVYARITAGLKHADVEVVYIPPIGVSVISDIDDTIKVTGILGGKRDLFRNVFVNNYSKIQVQGIRECYTALEKDGATFHYVSNSPWQLYPTICDFVKSAGFPKGSMHLKTYPNLANGIFEPAAEKKKKNLHQLLRDFPRRKFILFGDSGEADLEAYMDVSITFPNQIAAIMIRDVILPENDSATGQSHSLGREGDLTDQEIAYFESNYIPTPEEVDNYEFSKPQRHSKNVFSNNKNTPTRSVAPPLPPRRNQPPLVADVLSTKVPDPVPRSSDSDVPPLIDLSQDESLDTQVNYLNQEKSRDEPPALPPKISQDYSDCFVGATRNLSTSFVTQHNFSLNADNFGIGSQGVPDTFHNDTTTIPADTPLPSYGNSSSFRETSDSCLDSKENPPPLPKRPGSKSQNPNGNEEDAAPSVHQHLDFSPDPPPLPSRPTQGLYDPFSRLALNSQSFKSERENDSNVTSSQNAFCEGSRNSEDSFEVLDKRVYCWKERVLSARARLPASTVLRMWRVGSDVQQEAQEIMKREENKLKV